MHHIGFILSIQIHQSDEIEIRHEFGQDVLLLPEKKIVQLLLLMRKFVFHSLFLPINNAQGDGSSLPQLTDFIELELTGSLEMQSHQFVIDTHIGAAIQSTLPHQQAKIYAAIVMYLDRAGVMFVRKGVKQEEAL
jgi:hypothetical protein